MAKCTNIAALVPQSEQELVSFCLLAPPFLKCYPCVCGPKWLSITSHFSHQEGGGLLISFKGTIQKLLASLMFAAHWQELNYITVFTCEGDWEAGVLF